MPHSDHRARNLAVEGPVQIGRFHGRIKFALQFLCYERDFHDLRGTIANCRWNIGGIAGDIHSGDYVTLFGHLEVLGQGSAGVGVGLLVFLHFVRTSRHVEFGGTRRLPESNCSSCCQDDRRNYTNRASVGMLTIECRHEGSPMGLLGSALDVQRVEDRPETADDLCHGSQAPPRTGAP